MKIRKVIFFGVGMVLCTIIVSCTDGKFKNTLSGKKNYDSLFLGVYLGMDKKAFYDHCWKLNKEKVVVHGPTNQSVQYMLNDEFDQPVMMQFYPSFYNDKIVDMPVTFAYEAWAPWNKEYSSDTLFVKTLSLFKKWYGEEFKILQHPTMGTIYYKMDGRRRINLFIRDDQFVQAVFTELELEKQMKITEKKDSIN